MPRPHREILAIRSNEKRGRVVIVGIGLEASAECEQLLRPRCHIVNDRFDMAVALAAARDRADHEFVLRAIDDGSFVLKPIPSAVVVELSDRGGWNWRTGQRGAGIGAACCRRAASRRRSGTSRTTRTRTARVRCGAAVPAACASAGGV